MTSWALVILARRPRNRTVDDLHVRPENLARRVATLLGPDATVTLTARRVQLHVTGDGRLPDVAEWQKRLARLLHSVYLGRSPDALEGPVRTEIRQEARPAGGGR